MECRSGASFGYSAFMYTQHVIFGKNCDICDTILNTFSYAVCCNKVARNKFARVVFILSLFSVYSLYLNFTHTNNNLKRIAVSETKGVSFTYCSSSGHFKL